MAPLRRALAPLLFALAPIASGAAIQRTLFEIEGPPGEASFGRRTQPVGDVEADGTTDFLVASLGINGRVSLR